MVELLYHIRIDRRVMRAMHTRSKPAALSVPASLGMPIASWFLSSCRSSSPDVRLLNPLRWQASSEGKHAIC